MNTARSIREPAFRSMRRDAVEDADADAVAAAIADLAGVLLLLPPLLLPV